MTFTIVGCGLAESVGLFGAIACFASGSMIALIAPGVSLLLLFAQFPTRDKAVRFAESITSQA